MSKRMILIAVVAVAVVVAAIVILNSGGDDDGGAEADGGSAAARVASAEYDSFRAQETACGADAPPPASALEFPEPEDLQLTTTVDATIHTSCGDIRIQLYPDLAPETVNSFVFLAEQGYFDGTVSHRIIPGFVIQAGDPTATGRGGPGYRIPDELPAVDFVYDTGILAMANAGPNTTGSQFFIVTGLTQLPNAYSHFGVVISGYEVLSAIESVPLGISRSGEPSLPLESVYIESITIER